MGVLPTVHSEISISRDWKSRSHPRLALRLAGALAEPVSGGGSVAPLHLEKALRAWPNAICKCAAASDLGRRLPAAGRRPGRDRARPSLARWHRRPGAQPPLPAATPSLLRRPAASLSPRARFPRRACRLSPQPSRRSGPARGQPVGPDDARGSWLPPARFYLDAPKAERPPSKDPSEHPSAREEPRTCLPESSRPREGVCVGVLSVFVLPSH